MGVFELSALLIVVMLGALALGLWIAFSLSLVALVALLSKPAIPAAQVLATSFWSASTSWDLTALPMFIWMGEILYRTRLSEDMFKGLAPWMGRLPGGLLHTNIAGCTIFAAVSGSSAATLTTVGKMTIPELRKRRYPERLTIGTLAGAATLGLMIPPSLTLIVYGVAINESITKLFIAGIIPGLVLAFLFMCYVVIVSKLSKDYNPAVEPEMPFVEKVKRSRFLVPVLLLITLVIGSMYVGIATATEAAAIGVLGSLALAAGQRSLTVGNFFESLMGATRTSAMIALILAGAAFLSLSMGFTGLPRALAEWIASIDLSRFQLLMVLLVFYIILGCFLDGISVVVLTIAIVEPMIRQVGIDIIWFGIFIVVVVEMAQITPPIGFNLFVLQGMTGHPMSYIARAAFPMFLIMVAMVFILIIFPELATWLPENMRQAR